ncbi:hypothetical protein K7X08_033777 [Anisodus acutangulus]|uniref:Uncharacterized protein n=1 Tax=Anisodus acutangulus TaxID=402998 RepID=A0A9Q1M5V5_9SOLA|nr:hypothetical protein K7X08_033777 [Anisodus acutangulus]
MENTCIHHRRGSFAFKIQETSGRPEKKRDKTLFELLPATKQALITLGLTTPFICLLLCTTSESILYITQV